MKIIRLYLCLNFFISLPNLKYIEFRSKVILLLIFSCLELALDELLIECYGNRGGYWSKISHYSTNFVPQSFNTFSPIIYFYLFECLCVFFLGWIWPIRSFRSCFLVGRGGVWCNLSNLNPYPWSWLKVLWTYDSFSTQKKQIPQEDRRAQAGSSTYKFFLLTG